MASTRTYSAELGDLGHQQQTDDLYRMAFNPMLSAQESSAVGRNHSADLDVTTAQNEFRIADVLTLLYPLW